MNLSKQTSWYWKLGKWVLFNILAWLLEEPLVFNSFLSLAVCLLMGLGHLVGYGMAAVGERTGVRSGHLLDLALAEIWRSLLTNYLPTTASENKVIHTISMHWLCGIKMRGGFSDAPWFRCWRAFALFLLRSITFSTCLFSAHILYRLFVYFANWTSNRFLSVDKVSSAVQSLIKVGRTMFFVNLVNPTSHRSLRIE